MCEFFRIPWKADDRGGTPSATLSLPYCGSSWPLVQGGGSTGCPGRLKEKTRLSGVMRSVDDAFWKFFEICVSVDHEMWMIGRVGPGTHGREGGSRGPRGWSGKFVCLIMISSSITSILAPTLLSSHMLSSVMVDDKLMSFCVSVYMGSFNGIVNWLSLEESRL